MFRSTDPFGLAAIIAYVSSLSLTILFFSIPYFASYFINYHRKLHQIEEAMLLLSENSIPQPAIREQGGEPPYSSVMEIDAPVPDDTHIYKPPAIPGFDYPELGDPYFASDDDEQENELSQDQLIEKETSVDDEIENPQVDTIIEEESNLAEENNAPEIEAPPAPTKKTTSQSNDELLQHSEEKVDAEGGGAESSEVDQSHTQDEDKENSFEEVVVEEEIEKHEVKLSKPKKTEEELDREAGQLSLLDTMFDDPIHTIEVNAGPTIIHAFVLLDKGDELYVRGKSTQWKKKGVLMDQLDVGKYELILQSLDQVESITFWKNDKYPATNEQQSIRPGSITELYPEF